MENMNPSTATPSSAVKYSSFNVPLDSIYFELMQTMCISIGYLIKIEEKCYIIENIYQIIDVLDLVGNYVNIVTYCFPLIVCSDPFVSSDPQWK